MDEHRHHGGPHAHGHRHISLESLTDDAIICTCNQLTLKEIKEAVMRGAQTPADAFACYRLDIRCGRCVERMDSIMMQLKESLS